MKKLLIFLGSLVFFLKFTLPVFAISTTSDITNYTHNTLNIITLIAVSATVFFLVKGGYLYATSSGNPQALDAAKKTIRNAIIGLVLVLASSLIVSIFQNSVGTLPNNTNSGSQSFGAITPQTPSDGLTQVLIDAIVGLIQNVVQSAVSPITNAIIGYLSTTPSLLSNSVIFNFWVVSLGIVDSLFVVVVALLGLQFMSASSFGFEEVELKQLLPRIGLAFLGANVSLFLADYVIVTCNAMVNAVLNSTGGLSHAWVVDAINLPVILTDHVTLITLIFLIIFLIVSIVLLFMYIGRLIAISLGAVLSPFIFLLWAIPKFSDIAEAGVKTYIGTVFIIFIHVVVIQLASAFLAVPDVSSNPILAIVIAIGLFLTLIKIPHILMGMLFFTTKAGSLKKLGGQIINVISTDNSSSSSRSSDIRTPRKRVNL